MPSPAAEFFAFTPIPAFMYEPSAESLGSSIRRLINERGRFGFRGGIGIGGATLWPACPEDEGTIVREDDVVNVVNDDMLARGAIASSVSTTSCSTAIRGGLGSALPLPEEVDAVDIVRARATTEMVRGTTGPRLGSDGAGEGVEVVPDATMLEGAAAEPTATEPIVTRRGRCCGTGGNGGKTGEEGPSSSDDCRDRVENDEARRSIPFCT